MSPLFTDPPLRRCAKCGEPVIADLREWTDGKGHYWHGKCSTPAQGKS